MATEGSNRNAEPQTSPISHRCGLAGSLVPTVRRPNRLRPPCRWREPSVGYWFGDDDPGAMNAVAGGCYGLSGADGVPTEWLKGGPFSDYVVPSLVLLVMVGGSFLLAAMAGLHIAQLAAYTAGLIVLGWLASQLAMIGYVSWMQPATASAGALVLVLAWLLPQSARR